MKKITISLTAILLFAFAGFTITAASASDNSVSPVPQPTPEMPLGYSDVKSMLTNLKKGLPELVEDEQAVAAIFAKWDKQPSLVYKTRWQILQTLFADVRSVIEDKETTDAIWASWIAQYPTHPPEKPIAGPCTEPATNKRYPNRPWTSVASSYDGNRLIAAAGPAVGLMFEDPDFSASSGAGMAVETWYKTRVTGVERLYTSTDAGGTWVARGTPRRWISVASSADGTRLIAADVGGRLYISTDAGVSWTPHDQDRLWFAVTSSADGRKLAAVVNGGQIFTSSDAGATWTPRATTEYWHTIASSADGNVLVAAASLFNGKEFLQPQHPGHIYVSTDSGVTWQDRYQSGGNWMSVAISADGTKMVAAQYNYPYDDGPAYRGGIFRSDDSGVTWRDLKVSLGGHITDEPWFSIGMSSDGTKLVAVDQRYLVSQETRDRQDMGHGMLWISNDSGKSWSAQAVMGDRQRWAAATISGNGNVVAALAYKGDNWISRTSGQSWLPGGNEGIDWKAVAMSADGRTMMAMPDGAPLLVSTDAGANWDAVGPKRRWLGLASSADGTRLAAAAYASDCVTSSDQTGELLTSADAAASWRSRDKQRAWRVISSSADGNVLAAAASYFVQGNLIHKIGKSQIFVSHDSGATWAARETERDWRALALSSDGTRIAAVGAKTQVYTSADSGQTWTPHDSERNWTAIASSANGAKLVAAAGGAGVYTSADYGATWTARLPNHQWTAVASSADGTRLIAADQGGDVYTSSDSGANWTNRGIIGEWVSAACSADGSKIIVASMLGELMISTDYGATWADQAER